MHKIETLYRSPKNHDIFTVFVHLYIILLIHGRSPKNVITSPGQQYTPPDTRGARHLRSASNVCHAYLYSITAVYVVILVAAAANNGDDDYTPPLMSYH